MNLSLSWLKSVQYRYEWQSEGEASALKAIVDSDWAGCVDTRRSTSGGLIRLGRHTLKSRSITQAVVAMSSAEAELYALTEGAARGLGLRSMLSELGLTTPAVELLTDSSAAKSFLSRRGLGRMRHIAVKELWLQDQVKSGVVRLVKVAGQSNPADLLTKYHAIERARLLSTELGITIEWCKTH